MVGSRLGWCDFKYCMWAVPMLPLSLCRTVMRVLDMLNKNLTGLALSESFVFGPRRGYLKLYPKAGGV